MSSEEKRYNVTLRFSAQEVGGAGSIVDTEVNWNDMGYDGLVLVEREMIDALKRLNDFGLEMAKQNGTWKAGKKERE